MDEIKKGTVTLIGDCAYSIDIVYAHEHSPEQCANCGILKSRNTGRDYSGIIEMSSALSIILETYAYDIRMSELYSHARVITVTVFKGEANRFDRSAIEAHEIRKGQ